MNKFIFPAGHRFFLMPGNSHDGTKATLPLSLTMSPARMSGEVQEDEVSWFGGLGAEEAPIVFPLCLEPVA